MSLACGFTLGGLTTSKEFSDALQSVIKDGVTPEGGQFSLTVNGFTVTLSSGYALVAGRWLKNDEPLPMSIQIPDNTEDRTDALVIRADYTARTAALEILIGVDPDAIRADPSLLRDDKTYNILLYFIRVRRGITSLTPDDVTDLRDDNALCGRVVPLSAIAGGVLRVYDFLLSGIDREVARLIGLSEEVAQRADAAIVELDKAIQQAGGTAGIGELLTSRKPPAPSVEWLPCNGGSVPAEYPELSAMLGGTLPDIHGERYRTYIYGGAPR